MNSMKWIFHSILFLSLTASVLGQTNSKHIYVRPHTTKNGTYVEGHYRTAPNNTNKDNFSTKGNTNPYTGQPGWIQPDNKGTYSTHSTTTQNSTSETGNYEYSSMPKYIGIINSLGQKVITYIDGQEIFGLCNYCPNIIYKNELDYYWYTPSSGIQKTKGGSGGILLDGEYKFFNEKGNLIIKENYKKGIQHGDYITWDNEGNINEKGHFTDGVLDYSKYINEDGYWVEWKGEVLVKGSIKNIYTKYGTLIETSTIEENLTFHYKIYYEYSGKLKSEFTCNLLNFYNGDYISWYENGIPKTIGHFSENFKDGDWKYFNEDSSYTVITYEIYSEKNINGKLKIKGSRYYKKSTSQWVKDGIWVWFKENGYDWAYVKYYEDGVEVEKKK